LRRGKNIPLPNPITRDCVGSRALDFYFPGRDRSAKTIWFLRNIHHPHPPVGANVTETFHAFIIPLFPAFTKITARQAITPLFHPIFTRRSRSSSDSVDSSPENRAVAVFGRLLQGKIAVAPHRSRLRAEVS